MVLKYSSFLVSPCRFLKSKILPVAAFFVAGTEHGCQLSIPARMYAITIPDTVPLLFNIAALIPTAFAIKQQV